MIEFFTDPVLRGPTWGCVLMCLASSLMGVLIFLKKRSLLSESLSHATYPGAALGVALMALFFPQYEEWTFIAVLFGGFISTWLGLKAIHWLEQKGKVHADAALCFVIAVFFGVGVLIASGLQAQWPIWHKQVQMLLFGQAATMGDIHIGIFGALAAFVALFIFLKFRQLQAFLFDKDFSAVAKLPVKRVESILFWLLILSLVIGIRSVGVALMSAMVIAPAIAARQYTDRLQTIFFLAAAFGAISGLLGNYLSVVAHLPTGPCIVLVGTSFALFSLFFAPKRGLVFRMKRILAFKIRCLEENILKGMWKKGSYSKSSSLTLRFVLWRLKKQGWIDRNGELTKDGRQKAASIVRLHRLWELYLSQSLGFVGEKVHRTAEEMEHILTQDMEERLTSLLSNPKHDPHHQPIPEKGL